MVVKSTAPESGVNPLGVARNQAKSGLFCISGTKSTHGFARLFAESVPPDDARAPHESRHSGARP